MKNKIREFRTKDNLTLEYVSYVSHVSISYLCKLELGYKENPSPLVMERISKALEKSVDEVFFS